MGNFISCFMCAPTDPQSEAVIAIAVNVRFELHHLEPT